MPGVESGLRRARQRNGLKQAELAVRAGISRQTLSALEAGRAQPSTAIALNLARALGCRVEELFWLREEGGWRRARHRTAAAPRAAAGPARAFAASAGAGGGRRAPGGGAGGGGRGGGARGGGAAGGGGGGVARGGGGRRLFPRGNR